MAIESCIRVYIGTKNWRHAAGSMERTCSNIVFDLQVMGDELLEILEEQKEMEKQIRKVTSPGALRETARGITTAAESENHPRKNVKKKIKLKFGHDLCSCKEC